MPWTNEEKNRYLKNRKDGLAGMYLLLDLPSKNPRNRLKFLYPRLKPTMTGQKVFSNLVKQNKRDEALILLEDIILKNY